MVSSCERLVIMSVIFADKRGAPLKLPYQGLMFAFDVIRRPLLCRSNKAALPLLDGVHVTELMDFVAPPEK